MELVTAPKSILACWLLLFLPHRNHSHGIKPQRTSSFLANLTLFTIFSVSLFYNVATTNGTLDVLAQHILYRTRTHPNALYMILYLIATLLSALGAGFFTTMAVCCPLAITLCQKADKHPLIGAQAVNWGASGGANLITSGSGIVFQGLFKQMGWEEQAFHLAIISLSSALSTHSSSCFYYLVTSATVKEEQTHP